jgi:predicted DNA-binding ribbon-helix-helix protein
LFLQALRAHRLSPRRWKRSIVIAGDKTSVSLEDEFWNSLKEIAGERGMTLMELVAAIDGDRQHANLSSAIRLFVLGVYRDQPDHRKPTNLVYKPSVPERFQRTSLRDRCGSRDSRAEEEMEQMTRFAGLETTGLKLGDVASCDTFQSARF